MSRRSEFLEWRLSRLPADLASVEARILHTAHPLTDAQFLRAFEDRTLPFAEWTHRAHVRVAWLYLARMPLEVAIDRMRRGIRAYNATHNVPGGPDRGYHETTTVAFMRLIHSRLDDDVAWKTFDEFCAAHPDLLDKRVLLQFYSRDRIMSAEAKRGFVEPDLRPLPGRDA